MSELIDVPLRRADNGEFVTASLIVGVDEDYAARTDDAWLTYLATWRAEKLAKGEVTPKVEHKHWRWREKLAVTKNLLAYVSIGLEFEGDAQGLMMLVTAGYFGRHSSQTNLPLVYVEFLSAAPWNLRPVIDPPRFLGVGTVLIRTAIQLSFDLEFKGRLGLHSLPQSQGFYQQLGMLDLGADAAKSDLHYFELTPDGAQTFVG